MVESVSLWPLLLLVFGCILIAAAYASVGLGGGSGYLAIMTLCGISSTVMPSTSLTLNLIVSATALMRYGLAGRMNLPLFLPFALAAVPCAFVGGVIAMPERFFFAILAVVLLITAVSTFRSAGKPEPRILNGPPWLRWAVGLSAGAAMGLVSGALGIGGGIFLGPLVLLLRWAGPKEVAAMTAAFILCVSGSGLLGHGLRGAIDPLLLGSLSVAVLAGGTLGAHLGESWLSPRALRRILAVLILVAALKAGISAIWA